MLVQELLLEILEDLISTDFTKFKWYLEQKIINTWKPIAVSRLENASRPETVDIMLQSYGEASAVHLTVVILKKMSMNSAADKLNRAYDQGVNGGQAAAISTSSAPAIISAQQGSLVVAPTFNGGTPGSVNIHINRA